MSSYVRYTANGTTGTFSIPFPYISEAHVQVKSGSALMTLGAQYEVVGSNVVFRPAFTPAANSIVDIRRITPVTPLVAYQNGSVLTADDLNTATKQAIYAVEEVRDYYENILADGFTRLNNGTVVDVQSAIDAAVQSVLDSALLAELETRIGDIDTNAESIIAHNLELIDLQDQIDALSTVDGVGIATLIANEQAARISGDTALAETLALVGAKSGDNLSFILDLNKVKVSGSESLATRLSTLASTDADNSAAISAEATTRANSDGALATSISTLQTTVGGHTSSISTLQTVTNGLSAQYTVKVQATGPGGLPVIAGIGLSATAGLGSEVYILANKFAVVDPSNNTNVKVPFTVVGGVCYMQNVVIGDALIDSLTVNKLTTGTFNAVLTGGTNGVIKFGQSSYDVGTGYWLGYTGGAYKFSLGVGSGGKALLWDGSNLSLRGADLTLDSGVGPVRYLGTNVNGTYIDWYGTGAINDENAKFFIKKDGKAMFTGRLRGEFEPKAWASISGEGTPYVRDAFNVSSVAKYGAGTGRYRIYFHTALPNANYSCVASGSDTSKIVVLTVASQTTTYVDVETNRRGDGNFTDIGLLNILIFGSNVPGSTNVSNPSGSYGGGTRGGGLEP